MMPETVAVKGFLDGAGLLNIPAAAWTWSPLLETLPYLSAPPPPCCERFLAFLCCHPSTYALFALLARHAHDSRRASPDGLISAGWRRLLTNTGGASLCPSAVSEMLAVVSPQFPQYCQQLYPGELYKCLLGEYRCRTERAWSSLGDAVACWVTPAQPLPAILSHALLFRRTAGCP